MKRNSKKIRWAVSVVLALTSLVTLSEGPENIIRAISFFNVAVMIAPPFTEFLKKQRVTIPTPVYVLMIFLVLFAGSILSEAINNGESGGEKTEEAKG